MRGGSRVTADSGAAAATLVGSAVVTGEGGASSARSIAAVAGAAFRSSIRSMLENRCLSWIVTSSQRSVSTLTALPMNTTFS
jgi:hypothetical protein